VAENADSDDIKNLILAVHQDRAAAKAKDQREAWTKYVSLMIVVLAVVTAIGTLRSGSFGSRVLLNQARASDAWAFYQSKSIKRHLAEMEARAASSKGADSPAALEVSRYRKEEGDAKGEAEGFEKVRDENAKHGAPLAFGIALLQVSIALASVCLITKRRAVWVASAVLGSVGVGYVVFGIYLV
jgi:Domain of unknown function (DUF4337)